MCHVSHFPVHLLHVNCHLSLTPTATATDPPPANSPTMHSWLVFKDPKYQQKNQNPKDHQNGPRKTRVPVSQH